MPRAPHLFVIAGEPSGDGLGASLMAGLKSLEPGTRFSGVGGPLMTAQGLTSRFDMNELSVMGITEILPRLPRLLRRVRETAAAITATRPDAVITIDSPDFCLRVAARARRETPALATIHYVAPTVWAWRPGRAAKMARYIDHVLALFPFEPPFMEAAGMSCDFVGHPVVAEKVPTGAEIARFRQHHGLGGDQKLLLVLPGSRMGEVGRMEPVFADVARMLRAARPDLTLMLPAVQGVAEFLGQRLSGWPGGTILLDPRDVDAATGAARKQLAFAAADAALAASGTVSLELAGAGTPMVIAYKFNRLTTRIVKKTVNLRSATLVNILTDQAAVPEFLFEACTPDRIAPAVSGLLDDPGAQKHQLDASDAAMHLLGRGGEAPGLRAAKSVLAAL